jgi:lipoprotein-anchoring transpeptidase ErfK/SrfK
MWPSARLAPCARHFGFVLAALLLLSAAASPAAAAQEEGSPDANMIAPAMPTEAAAGEPTKETAEAPPAPKPIVTTLAIAIDLAQQKLVVSAHGKTIHTWPISSGTREFPTPTGTFRPGWMAKLWLSRKYDDAPMPHAIFFKDGAAIHATTSTGSLGRPASHGCVRLAPANAAALYALVTKHGMAATRISVFGTPRWREPVVASRPTGYASVRSYGTTGPYPGSRYVAYAPASGLVYPGDAPPAPVAARVYAFPNGSAPVGRVNYPAYGRYLAPGYARY